MEATVRDPDRAVCPVPVLILAPTLPKPPSDSQAIFLRPLNMSARDIGGGHALQHAEPVSRSSAAPARRRESESGREAGVRDAGPGRPDSARDS